MRAWWGPVLWHRFRATGVGRVCVTLNVLVLGLRRVLDGRYRYAVEVCRVGVLEAREVSDEV